MDERIGVVRHRRAHRIVLPTAAAEAAAAAIVQKAGQGQGQDRVRRRQEGPPGGGERGGAAIAPPSSGQFPHRRRRRRRRRRIVGDRENFGTMDPRADRAGDTDPIAVSLDVGAVTGAVGPARLDSLERIVLGGSVGVDLVGRASPGPLGVAVRVGIPLEQWRRRRRTAARRRRGDRGSVDGGGRIETVAGREGYDDDHHRHHPREARIGIVVGAVHVRRPPRPRGDGTESTPGRH
mmetsp:Transcript_25108/g.73546  ORF Transcript_25108/g.73546 Transcript_25108/m.73546 type:complete len:236 (+) Transcript_25108:1218-1925(+)